MQAQDGNLYGTTNNGTIAVLYKITTAGVFTPLVTLAAQSYSPLILATNGNLYGTTLYGGTFNGGTIFQFTPTSKAFKTLFNFKTEYSPWGPLMQGVDGALYGTTSTGGTGSGGTLFKITTAGVYKVLVNFISSGANGSKPFSGVVQGSDKLLYGVTSTGGANGQGVLYKVSTTGSGYTDLHDFITATGDTPLSTPLLHTNGTIYGLTSHGGSIIPNGVLYSMNVGLKEFVAPVVLHAGKVSSSVELLGQGFNTATGVLFGTGSGQLTIVNDTYATAKIATGASTGLITVKEPGGNLTTLQNFKITPAIKNFHTHKRAGRHFGRNHRNQPAENLGREVRRSRRHLHSKLGYPGDCHCPLRRSNRQNLHHYTRWNRHQFRRLHRELINSRATPHPRDVASYVSTGTTRSPPTRPRFSLPVIVGTT